MTFKQAIVYLIFGIIFIALYICLVSAQSDFDNASEMAKLLKAAEVASSNTTDCKIINGILWCRETDKEIKDLYKELKK